MNGTSLIRWNSLWAALGAHGDPMPVRARLIAAYSEPHRHYHTLGHLAECLTEFDAVRTLTENPNAIEAALWFHDVIYDPRSSDNEHRSADFAANYLNDAAVSATLIATVRQLILATQHHPGERTGDTALLTDVDLAILGQPVLRFQQYEEDIQHEYAWVPPAPYAEKRGALLAAFLARPSLYATKYFREKYEAQARINLAESLRRLQPPATSL